MDQTRILVVEDERIVGLDIKRMLQTAGYVVAGLVSSGERAIKQVAESRPDLVLMDIRLQGQMDGVTAATLIRQQFDLPVIYLTAFSDEATLQRAKITGPYGYLLKPLNERELIATIETALYRHQAEAEIRQRNRELLALQAASAAISSSLDLQSVLKTVTREMANLLDVESCYLSGWDQVDDTRQKIAAYVPEGWRGDGPEEELHCLTDDSVTKQVLVEQRPIQMTISQPNIDPSELAYMQQAQIKTLMMLPLVYHGRTIGLVNIEDSQSERTFTDHEVSLALALVSQAASAIENARLFEQARQEIVERKQAEAKLRQREVSYRTVVENQTELVCRFLPDTTLTFVNEAYCRYWGKSREELIGKSFLTVIPEESRQVVKDAIHSLIAKPRTEVFEHKYAFPDGRVIWQHWTDQPLYDSEGQLVEFQSVGRDVTQRKLAEEALAQREAHYRSLFEDSPIPLYEEDLSAVKVYLDGLCEDGITDFGEYFFDNPQAVVKCAQMTKILEVNQAALEINRADRKEALLGELDQYFVEASYEGYRQELIALAAGERIVSNEIVTQPLDGPQNIQISKITILPGYEETWAKVLVSSLDITERKRAEEALQHRNRELALLNEVIEASVRNLEPEKFLETACRELAQALSMSQAAALLLSEDKNSATVVAEHNPINPGGIINKYFPIRPDSLVQTILRDKTPIAVSDVHNEPRLTQIQSLIREHNVASLLLLPLTVENGVIGFLILAAPEVRDFSPNQINLARTVVEQIGAALSRVQLQKQRSQLSAVIEQTSESVVITDGEGDIQYVNPAFEKITGYRRSEVIGRNPRLLKSGKQSPAFYRELWQTISSGQVWHGRLVNKKKDGSLFTEEATITPIRDELGRVVNYVAVKRDVTRELQLEEQYRQAQKMEAIGLLAGGIAHDFNNLLTAINGFAELLQLQLPADSPHQELIEKIIKGGRRAAALVRQLLAFSRKQIIEPKTLNLNTRLEEFERMLGRLIGEHIQLETVLAPELWFVKADPSQIEQVFLNLAVNARDAMPDGGQLTIETANMVLGPDETAKHLELDPGEYVMVAISDTGIGMSKAVQARIFEPFFTTKEMGKGTGLGLATVYGIVKQNNGSIWVYSEEGQGTTFKIYLPRVAEAADSLPEQSWTQALPRGSETILLVEDEPVIRELVTEMLRIQGYQVLEANDGFEALRLAQELDGTLNLLVTDVIMPGMNGNELASKLKESRPNLKVLFMSGYSDEMIARHGVLEPGVVLIEKPFDSMRLAQKVRQVLETAGSNNYDYEGKLRREQTRK